MGESDRRTTDEDARRLARRALLRRAAWVVPAIVGSFLVTRAAAAQSCVPVGACSPDKCGPIANCGPDLCRPAFGCKPTG